MVDFYTLPHRGLRWALCRCLIQAGKTDYGQTADLDVLQADLETTFGLLKHHLHHEEASIHPALARVVPGLVQIVEEEHAEHRHHMDELERRLERARKRLDAGRGLYLCLSHFVAENISHMVVEETTVQRALDEHYDANTLSSLHDELIARIDHAEMVAFLRVMLPAMSQAERCMFLAGPRSGMPDELFAQLLTDGSVHLSEAERTDLIRWAEVAS